MGSPFAEAHLALLNRLTAANEPTSALPGNVLDKRTIRSTFDQLEAAGLVKILTATLQNQLGLQKQSIFAYDTKYSLEEVNQRLSILGRWSPEKPSSIAKADTPLVSIPEGKHALYTLRDDDLSLLCHEKGISKVMLDREKESYLKEKQSLSQWYGAPLGKMHRALNLHLWILRHFSSASHSSRIVSSDPKVVHISLFWTDITLSEYCSFVPIHHYRSGLRNLLQTSPDISIKDVPRDVGLDAGLSRSRLKICELLNILGYLQLVTPLHPCAENPTVVLKNPSRGYPEGYEAVPISERNIPHFWMLADSAPLVSFREEAPVPVASIDILPDPQNYWDRVKLLAIDNHKGGEFPFQVVAKDTQAPDLPGGFVRSIKRESSWKADYMLSRKQIVFLRSFVSPEGQVLHDALSAEVLSILSETIFAPEEVIARWFKDHSEHRREISRRKIEATGISDAAAANALEADARRRVQRSLAGKAASAKRQRSGEWDETVRMAYSGPLDSGMQFRLEPLRNKYMSGIAATSPGQWSHDILQAISGQVPIPAGLKKGGERQLAMAVSQPIVTSGKSVDELIAELGASKPARHTGSKAKAEEGVSPTSS